MRALRGLLPACAAALLGCGGGATDTTSDGRIQITVTTGGADPQTEEYLLTLAGARPLAVTPNGRTATTRYRKGPTSSTSPPWRTTAR